MTDFTFIRRINYYETDRMGVVHHSNYIRFLEEARCKMLNFYKMPYSAFEKKGVMIPELSVNCNDVIEIKTSVKDFNGVRLTMGYNVIEQKTGNLVLIGETKHCFTDLNLKPIRLQKKIPDFYNQFINLL